MFGVTLDLQVRLRAAGVEFHEPHRRAVEPDGWRSYYKMRTLTLRDFDAARLERQYAHVQNTLESYALASGPG